MTDDLVAFLRARLDEDEQTAREAAGAPWALEVSGMVHVSSKAIRDAKWKWGKLGYVATVEHAHDRAHIARHDPARVLREVQAKRELLKLHAPVPVNFGDEYRCTECARARSEHCSTLRLLALPYAGHPDYRDAWRPWPVD